MARAAGDVSLKWIAAQEYTISGYQNLANAAYAVGSELDLSALDNVVDLLIGSKHKTASGTPGDYLELVARQTSGAPKTVAADELTWFALEVVD